jgi:hypothetical protein
MRESPELTAERLESLKAGGIAALSLALIESLLFAVNRWLLAERFAVLAPLLITSRLELLVKVAVAFVFGLLFGITYRYAIREDENPQLKAGVVLAFGLVQGLAPVEFAGGLVNVWLLVVFGIESILGFAIARLALDVAFRRHWVKPFQSNDTLVRKN